MKNKTVTLDNLHDCYWDVNRNIYVNGELVEGFSEDDVKMAIVNGSHVICK